MIFIRHFKWGKHIRVTGDEPTNDDVAYAVGLLDPRFPPPAIIMGVCNMEVTVKWEWDNNRPRYPWAYHVKIGDAQGGGYCNSMGDCFDAVEEFVADVVEKAIMESVCQTPKN